MEGIPHPNPLAVNFRPLAVSSGAGQQKDVHSGR
jgi:hypothetical protein